MSQNTTFKHIVELSVVLTALDKKLTPKGRLRIALWVQSWVVM